MDQPSGVIQVINIRSLFTPGVNIHVFIWISGRCMTGKGADKMNTLQSDWYQIHIRSWSGTHCDWITAGYKCNLNDLPEFKFLATLSKLNHTFGLPQKRKNK